MKKIGVIVLSGQTFNMFIFINRLIDKMTVTFYRKRVLSHIVAEEMCQSIYLKDFEYACIWNESTFSTRTVYKGIKPLYKDSFDSFFFYQLVVNTSWSFPHSWLITVFVTRLTRRMSLVEQELLIPSEYLSSLLVLSGVRVTRSLFLYVCFVDHCLSFELFLLTIVLSVLLRYMDSDYPFSIFKLFFGC
jgi:hypothetical protein